MLLSFSLVRTDWTVGQVVWLTDMTGPYIVEDVGLLRDPRSNQCFVHNGPIGIVPSYCVDKGVLLVFHPKKPDEKFRVGVMNAVEMEKVNPRSNDPFTWIG